MRRALLWVAILGVVFVGGLVLRDRLSSSAGDLKVGDCFQEPQGESIQDVQHTPCNEPHTGEVYVVANYPTQDAYPSTTDFEAWVKANCVDQGFETYTGRKYQDATDVAVGWFYPKQENWPKDTEVTCYMGPQDGAATSTSYKKP